jgi:hypothetical protein
MEFEVKVKRCHPVAGVQFQTAFPEFNQMGRDELYANYKVACKWPKGRNPMADAIIAEWDGRFNYWAEQDLKAKVAVHNSEVSFREEVINELISMGIARHVAANLTNTESKLLAKAKEIGYI